MTHLPNISPEQALAVLLKDAVLQTAPVSRSPLPLEAVIGIGRDNIAIVSIHTEDLEALEAFMNENHADPVSFGTPERADGQTVRTDLKDGKVVALESYRPVSEDGEEAPEDRVAYALRELDPFIELARKGKIRSLVVAAELVDERVSITYPVSQWEPGLIAATELVRLRLLNQG